MEVRQVNSGIIKTVSKNPLLFDKNIQANFGTKLIGKAWGVYSGEFLQRMYIVTSDFAGFNRAMRMYTVRMWIPMADVILPLGGIAMYPNAATALKVAKQYAIALSGGVDNARIG